MRDKNSVKRFEIIFMLCPNGISFLGVHIGYRQEHCFARVSYLPEQVFEVAGKPEFTMG
jgi:hypothetical protein